MAEFVESELSDRDAEQLTDDALAMYHNSLPADTPSERQAAAFGFLVRWGLFPVQPYPGPAPLAGGIEPRKLAKRKEKH